MHRHRFQCTLIQRGIQYPLLLCVAVSARQVGLELGEQQGNAFAAAALVAYGKFTHDLIQRAAIIEYHP